MILSPFYVLRLDQNHVFYEYLKLCRLHKTPSWSGPVFHCPTVTKVFLKVSSLLHFKLITFSLLLWCIEHLFIPVFFAGASCSNFGILFSNVLIPFSIFQCAALGVCKTGRKEGCRKKTEKYAADKHKEDGEIEITILLGFMADHSA